MKRFGILLLAFWAGIANAGTINLDGGDTYVIQPNTSATVTCSGSGSGGGTGTTFQVTSEVDLSCYEAAWVNSNYNELPYSLVIDNLKACRTGTIDSSKCLVTGSKSSTQCIELAVKSSANSYFTSSQATEVATLCKSVVAQCKL